MIPEWHSCLVCRGPLPLQMQRMSHHGCKYNRLQYQCHVQASLLSAPSDINLRGFSLFNLQ